MMSLENTSRALETLFFEWGEVLGCVGGDTDFRGFPFGVEGEFFEVGEEQRNQRGVTGLLRGCRLRRGFFRLYEAAAVSCVHAAISHSRKEISMVAGRYLLFVNGGVVGGVSYSGRGSCF